MPAAQNPYRKNELFVGRGTEMAAVRSHLASGQSTLLIGGRRAGKTFLASRLNNVGRPLARLDAGGWALDSEANVLNAIGQGVDRAKGVKSPKRAYTRDLLTERLTNAGDIAIVIDEADRILGETWAGSFLHYLRSLDDAILRSKIAFLLIGGPGLAEYRDPDDNGSPPLNTADLVYLEPLTSSDVAELIAGLPNEVAVEEVMQHAGGHPWLINKTLTKVWDGQKLHEAVDSVWENAVRNFAVWHRQVGQKGVAFLKALPHTGLSRSEFRTGTGTMARHREGWLKCRYTCLVRQGEDGKYLPGPKLFLDWLSSADGVEPQSWDLALSYASENVELAKSIYEQLRTQFKVFFAPAANAYLWGHDLNTVLPQTYGVESRFVLVLSSESYVNKYWPGVEFAAASKSAGDGRLLVVNLGKLPAAMPRDLVFMDANHASMVGLVETIKEKLSHA